MTAKTGTQSIAASLMGTGVGIGLSLVTTSSTSLTIAFFVVLSSIHLFANYKSLSVIELNTLNEQRFHLLTERFFSPPSGAIDCANGEMSIFEIARAERFVFPLPFKPSLTERVKLHC